MALNLDLSILLLLPKQETLFWTIEEDICELYLCLIPYKSDLGLSHQPPVRMIITLTEIFLKIRPKSFLHFVPEVI